MKKSERRTAGKTASRYRKRKLPYRTSRGGLGAGATGALT
jgi:hypothetical protein